MEKKSEDEWEVAEAIPITEKDMVGDILQDQETKNKEQFVFLTQEDADMAVVTDKLDDLTKRIAKLSTGVMRLAEVAQLFGGFRGRTLTRAGVERALECYIIVKIRKEHVSLLNRPYQEGVGYATMKKQMRGKPWR